MLLWNKAGAFLGRQCGSGKSSKNIGDPRWLYTHTGTGRKEEEMVGWMRGERREEGKRGERREGRRIGGKREGRMGGRGWDKEDGMRSVMVGGREG